MKFFLVDDDKTVLNLMGRLLEAEGHQVSLSHLAASAILDIAGEAPDCVITDLHMFGMDGIELVQSLKKSPEMQKTKMILVTTSVDDRLLEKAKASGIDAVIDKSLGYEEFVGLVEAALQDT